MLSDSQRVLHTASGVRDLCDLACECSMELLQRVQHTTAVCQGRAPSQTHTYVFAKQSSLNYEAGPSPRSDVCMT